jgi:uncharacterized protein
MTESSRSLWQKIFLSPSEPRLRAGWRLAIQTIFMLIILVVLTFALSISAIAFKLDVNGSIFFAASTLITFFSFTLSVYLARRLLDRRSFGSLGLHLDRHTFPDLLAGIVITFIIMGLIYWVMASLGWLQFSGFAWSIDPLPLVVGQLSLYFILFVMVGWQEELLSRGYHLQTIASGTNLFWGVVLSSIIFGILHLANPNATWVSALGIFFAGIFLALGYLRTGQLWLSIGLHIGWNFFEGVVFGFPVSGITTYPLLRIQVTGPELWTGGPFGPEAGLIILPALLIGAGLIYIYTRGRSPAEPEV